MQTKTIERVFIIDRHHDDAMQQQAVVEDYCPNALIQRCRHAGEAFNQLRKYPNIPVDLVLLNIEEYPHGGSQFISLAQMRATAFDNSPVVILTVSSHAQVEALKSRQMYNYSDFIHKPFVPEFFEYLLEFHFSRDGLNSFVSPSADSP